MVETKRTLNSWTLTLYILACIGVPISFGLLLSFFTKRFEEPPLGALIRLDSVWLAKNNDNELRRLVPCILVKNPTPDAWRNLSIGLNKQFYAQEPKGVAGESEVAIPLEAFIARNGSVPFPVGNREVERVIVFAQVKSGARAVSEFLVPENHKSSSVTKPDWISPKPRSSITRSGL